MVVPDSPDMVKPDGYLNITIPDPACYGDMVEIISNPSGGSGDYSYVWPGSSDPCDCESYEHEFDIDDGEEQVVTFDIIDNCTNETFSQDVTIVLQVTEQPVTEISIIGEQFCPGDEISLSAQSEGESTYTYEWIDLDDGEWYDNEQANISPDDSDLDDGDPETSTYYVTVIDDCNGFSWIEQIDITVPVYEEPTFDLPDLEGCVGDVLEIIPQDQLAQGVQSEDDFTYLWSNGETTPTIEIVVEEDPTEYSLVLMDLCGFEGDENIEGDMAIANITVSVPPAPEFTFDQDVEDVQFIQLTEGIFSNYEWDFDNDGTIDSYEFEPTHTYEEEGDFTVVLTAYDDLGCENKFNAIINVSASLFFYAPDIFTPNGDGINEAFHVSVVGHQQNGFELSVFDRWGKQVFYTTDPNEGWDGKYLNGTEVPQDVYLYKATMIKEGGEDETVRKGKVSIVK